MALQRIHAIITGRVQGVGFRQTTKQKASEIGITGWVMNRKDGGVEVIAEGSADVMDSFLDYLSQGPPSARVDNVRHINETPTGEFDGFKVTYAGY